MWNTLKFDSLNNISYWYFSAVPYYMILLLHMLLNASNWKKGVFSFWTRQCLLALCSVYWPFSILLGFSDIGILRIFYWIYVELIYGAIVFIFSECNMLKYYCVLAIRFNFYSGFIFYRSYFWLQDFLQTLLRLKYKI